MANPGGTYQRTVIRQRMLYRGVPDRDEWDELTDLERDVARSLVEERGEAALNGSVLLQQFSMDAAFAALMVKLDDAFPDGPLSSQNVETVEQASREALAEFSMTAEDLLRQGREEGIRRGLEAHQQGLNRAASQAGVEVSDQVIMDIADQVRGRADERRAEVTVNSRQLLRRRTTGAADDVAGFVRDNVGRPGRDASRELLNRLATNADDEMYERVQVALNNQGQRGQRVRKAIQGFGRAAEDLQDDAKNLYPNAKRVLVHEQNTIFHEADVLAAEQSPAVRALRWRVSNRHPFLESSPDACDVAAEADIHGFGKGLYHPGSTPSLIHPYCECTTVPVTVDPDQWGNIEYSNNQAPNREPDVLDGQEIGQLMRKNLTGSSGDVTAAKIDHAQEIFRQRTQVAYDAFIDF